MIRSNWNTHTYRCGHAVGTDEEYVLAAIRAGMSTLGFSDHQPFRQSCQGERMDYEQLEEYRQSVLDLKEKYRDRIRICLGLEVEYYQSQREDLTKFRKEMEYCILGQHQIEYQGMSSYQLFDENGLKYYIDQVEAACSAGFCDYIEHPDVFMWAYPKTDGSAKEAANRIAQISAMYNVPLELNCGGIRFGRMEYHDGYRYPYPTRVFFREAAKYNCTIIPGLDAHDPEELEREDQLKQAMSIVRGLKLNIVDDYDLIAEAQRRKKQMRFL